jgi:hypothetical protein
VTVGIFKRLLFSSLLAAAPAMADEAARIRELEQKLERSIRLIEELSAKVNRLEQGAAAQPAASGGVPQARVEALERQVEQLGSGLSRRSLEEAVQLRGFADVGFGHSGENNATFRKGRKGFGIGNLDLYLTPQLGDRVRALVELAFEVHDGHTEADLERIQFGYTFNDAATGWLGRFHTPYGYWNTAFHHGAQLQTSILRPRFLDFEEHTGILPAHTVGAWLTGAVPTAPGRLGYDVYLGNSPRIEVENPMAGRVRLQAGGGEDHSYMGGFNVWLEPRAVEGLRFGLHGLRGDVGIEGGATPAGNRTRLGILGGHAVYSGGRWEVMGEYFHFRNKDLSGGSGLHRSWAGYVQAGYAFGTITPYLRLENAQLDQADNYFLSQRYGRSYRRAAMGLRYDLDPRAAVKVELLRTVQGDLPGGDDRYDEARVQYSIRF